MLLKAEQSYLKKQLNIVSGVLEVSRFNTYVMAHDLADWDDSARFVLGDYPTFLDDNWSDESLLELYRFNFVIFTDRHGNPKYVEFHDYLDHKVLPVPEGFPESVIPLAQSVVAKAALPVPPDAGVRARGRGGFIQYDGIPYYVACMPIKKQEENGAEYTPGTVLLGYIMANEEMRKLTHIATADFRFVFPDKDGDTAAKNSAISRESDSVVASMIPYRDIEGNPVYLRMSEERDIYLEGREAVARTALLLAGGMAVFGLVMFLVVSRLAVRPIVRLSKDIRSGAFTLGTPPDAYASNLEFVTLCRAIGGMLGRLEESSLSLHTLQRVLDGVDAQIFVSDPETDEMFFANAAMRKAHNLPESVRGLFCYRATLPGWDRRCEACRKDGLNGNEIIEWEQYNKDTGRYYRKTDTLIDWIGGTKAHLQCSVDMTESKKAEAVLQRRLEQQELMSAMSRLFVEPGDMDPLIDRALAMAGEFMNVTRLVLVRLDRRTDRMIVDREWSNPAEGLADLRGMDLGAPEEAFYQGFMKESMSHAAFEDASEMGIVKVHPELGVKSLFIAPVHVSGAFWGVLGFDETRRRRRFEDSEIQLGILIASLISGAMSRNFAEEDMREAKELAERSSMAKGEFLSRMSHEMRTPLNAIIGMTSIAKGSNELEKKIYCLDKIEDASHHLLGVINDILDMSKIEANKFELVREEFVFEKMLMRVVNVVNYRIDEKEQNFIVNVDKDVPYAIISDEQRLMQVITNLLANAVKFTPENGTITFNAGVLEDLGDEVILRIDVTDTGIGISKEQQSRLFASFEQADGGINRKYGGTGLGLAISRNIIELMGGSIWIESEPGQGATFAFTLKAGKGAETRRSMLGPNVNWNSLRVLAVDDAPEVREYFLNLAASVGLACEVAADGREAVAILENNSGAPYNIVFADWKMPGMNGIELTKHVKRHYGGQAVVIMISATEWAQIEFEAKAAGVDKFIPKPLFSSLIVDCINECLGSQGLPEENGGEGLEDGQFAGRRILLAEDIDINREIVLALLQNSGLTIDCAENGEEAVAMFAANPSAYSMIFMDIHMPGVDGYAATRRIRGLAVPEAATVPIVAMTANVFKEDIERCLAAGMNDHIGKPVDLSEIYRKLRQYVKIAAASS